MKRYIIAIIAVLITPVYTNSQTLSSESLLKDFNVLKAVLLEYHPGLYRFQDSLAVAKNFNNLEQQLKHDLTLAEAYIAFSKFTASIRCGHTFCSFYNQTSQTKDSLFNKSDKVPITFFIVEKRIFIDKNVSENETLLPGTEVIEIGQVPVFSIIDSLIQYVKGDGNNNRKRLDDLNLSGLGKYEAFDIFHPLLYPPVNDSYKLKIRQPGKLITEEVNVKTISRSTRFQLMENKYGKQPATFDDLWRFKLLDQETGYLKIGTFVTNKLSINWKKFIQDAFDELTEKNIQHLVIDIRGNEGGDDEVNLVLGNRLAKKQLELPEFSELLRYEQVSETLRPYLYTWDNRFFNRKGQLKSLQNGFYTWKKERKSRFIKQNSKAFTGNTYLLVDAANSSATFFLTACMQQNKLATIIGTETGGNRKGTNGGQLFFLRLPHSTIEVDIPLIGYYPLTVQPDCGIQPDIEVQPSISDMLSGKDKVLEKTLELIRNK